MNRNDLDTTSIGLTVSDHVDVATKHKIMDEMLKYRNSDGIMQVYFDHSRPRIGGFTLCSKAIGSLSNHHSYEDPVVCANVLNFFYENGRGHELSATLDWIEKVLENRAYISGTYYYVSADQFLFFLSRLLHSSSEVRQRLGPMFKERITERFGAEADSLSLAARITAASEIGIVDDRGFDTLLSMQSEDGSWKDGWFYKYGASGLLIRNDGVTTAFAIRAIQQVEELRQTQSKLTAISTRSSPLLSTFLGRAMSLSGFLNVHEQPSQFNHSRSKSGQVTRTALSSYRYNLQAILPEIYVYWRLIAIMVVFHLFFAFLTFSSLRTQATVQNV